MPELELKLDEQKWKTLLNSIRQKNCILMLGPDAAIVEKDGKQIPIMEICANQLASEIDEKIREKINISDLAQVSQYYHEEFGRGALETAVHSFLEEEEKRETMSEYYRTLAALPFEIIITTTPDDMFYMALREEGKEPVSEGFNFKKHTPQNLPEGTIKEPLVYHLYGKLDELESLMLTENDLLDFLVALISGRNPLPDYIRSQLQEGLKTYLFIGFGFRHWYLRILLHVLRGRNSERYAFAMEQFVPENQSEFHQNIFFFQKSKYKVFIFEQNLNEFVATLKAKFQSLCSIPASRLNPEDAPWVFICHAKENRGHAKTLYKKLEAADLNPWMDEEDLNAGDGWDRKIQNIINKKVDYFVVLQSQELTDKEDSYVNKEIFLALDRQLKFRENTGFIYPIRIDESPVLSYLEPFQAIEWSDGNIKELIKTIKRHFAKRRNR